MSTKDKTDDTKGQQDVIESLYEVAMDPSRYEALLDHWEEMIKPHRAGIWQGDAGEIELGDLAGHVGRADRVLDRVISDNVPHGPDAVLAQIDRAAAFAVGRDGRVVGANAGAENMLGVRTGADLSDLDLDKDDAVQLGTTVARLISANQDGAVVLRARARDADRLIVFHLRAIRTDETAPYVMVVSSDIHWPKGFTDMLRSAFEFTPAESDVVRALTEGRNLQQIADNRGRSIDTIRAQLKSIMGKTETRSQTELVRLTLSTMEIASYTQDTSDSLAAMSEGYKTLAPRPFHTLSLGDGRQMDYLILGDTMGVPAVYMPLDFGLVRWPAAAEAEAKRRGIKVITPVRPGYGNSTPLAKGTPYVAQICDDIAALLDHLSVKSAPFLTLGGDTHITMMFGEQYPDRITALIACAGVLPLTRSEQYERMDKWHRFILAGARHTPHLLPFMVKAGFALAKRIGKRGFIQAVYGNSVADVTTFERPDIMEAMVCGSEVCLSDTHSAHDAFSAEVISHETTDWRETAAFFEDRIPVVFLNGMQDPQVPPETLSEFQEDYPWIKFRVYPDAGQLVFFLKWQDALDELEPYLTRHR